MASAASKKSCVKCPKSPGQVLCDGCQQYFCIKHLNEHRQDLFEQIDELSVEHDQLQQNLSVEQNSQDHSLFVLVDRWESRSIDRIREVANDIRYQLRYWLPQSNRNIQESLRQLKNELQENRQAETFTEIDLTHWMNQLKESKEQMEKPSMIEIQHEDDETLSTHIPLIHLRIRQNRVHLQITNETRRSPNGRTVAGGHGRGDALNQLYQPYAFDIDDDGTLFIADTENHRIMRWKMHATHGEIVVGGRERGNRMNQLNEPIAIVIDRTNRSLIISDWGNRRVIRWSLDPYRQDTVSGEVIISQIYCFGLAMDDEGSLYVSDHDRQEVRRYGQRDGREGVVVAGGNGRGDALNQFSGARNIFVDDEYSVYVSDRDNHRVMKWKRNAQIGAVVAGGRGEGNGLGQLSWPSGIFVDRMGSLYIADQFNHRLMRWLNGSVQGEVMMGGNDPGSQSNQLSSPTSISIDRQGNLYIVDRDNHRIQCFDVQ